MKIETLHDLFLDELRDMYDAENRIVKALPKMAENATHPALQKAFKTHLKETEGQIERLEKIFDLLDEKAKGETCEATKGLIEEAEDLIKHVKDKDVLDCALILAAQKVEHYEIGSYGGLVAIGKLMGHSECVRLLEETLEQEKNCDVLLTQIAEREINSDAFRKAA